ncbi:uncharacterized protein LOC116292681 [Actinia tenebrosa]|uniref:Uncharacterized protein LOC116292681 n=1 Tax=Actinia tenebrosa TaxID=6105 RepID=A0A6P8HT95_ACTTE|nr:uncharacterized protein LOC116292681 [Actinia tenebrosa]
MLLKQETGVLNFLSDEKLVDKRPCCVGVSFALRLCGILWSKDYNVNDTSTFFELFAKSRENENLWDEAIVRHGYLTGLQSLTSSNEGQKWLQAHTGCLLTAVGCISDSSMFVASAAREFIAKFLLSSWSINVSKQDDGYSNEMKWLLELLQEKLFHDKQQPNNSQHQKMTSDHIVSVLDIVRILLNTNFEVGQEILRMSKVFANCVTAAEIADQIACRKLVDVINGFQINPSAQCTVDWDKLLSCDRFGPSGEKQGQSAQEILLTIPIKWYKKGMITLALDLITGLSLPKDTVSRCFPAVWPEILACLINAPMEVLMEKHLETKCNGSCETNTSDIGSLVTELLSLENEDVDTNIKRVKKQIQELLEPWMLTKKCQVESLLQILFTIKELVTKDESSFSQHVVNWIEFSLKILVNSSMVTNGDQKLLALDVKGNVKVIKTTLSVVTVLLQQLLRQPSLTDSNRNQFFHVLNTAILVARSSRTDPTVITSTLECIGALLGQGSFLFMSSTNKDLGSDAHLYYQRTKQDLGSLIHLRLRDQRWEVKDSALEFVGRLIKLNSALSYDILNPSILSLVWESVDDSESYVRSSAWSCLGHLACNPGLWAKLKEKERLTEFEVLKKIVHVLENESEAFPRRSVMDCLIKWSHDQHPIVSVILPDKMKLSSSTGLDKLKNTDSEIRSLFSDIIRYAVKDFDWEVKIRALQLVETIIQIFAQVRESRNESRHSQQCQLKTLERTSSDNDGSINNLMALLVGLGAAVPLLEAVNDCDSLVCEKALEVISTLKGFVHSEITHTHLSGSSKTGIEFQPYGKENLYGRLDEQPNESKENNQLIVISEEDQPVVTPEQDQPIVTPEQDQPIVTPEQVQPIVTPEQVQPIVTSEQDQPIVTPEQVQPIETQEQVQGVIDTSKVFSVDTFKVILYRLDVSCLSTLCTSIDISVQKDPVGFLEDVLVAARNHSDNLLDCY